MADCHDRNHYKTHDLVITLKCILYHIILYATQCHNFDFKIRRNHKKKKNSNECHAYELIDDGIAYLSLYLEKRRKNNPCI